MPADTSPSSKTTIIGIMLIGLLILTSGFAAYIFIEKRMAHQDNADALPSSIRPAQTHINAGSQRADEPTNAQDFQDWRYECWSISEAQQAAKNTQGAMQCRMFQTIVNQEHRVQLLNVTLVRNPNEKTVIRLLAPLGVAITQGLNVRIDDGEVITLPLTHCTPQGCAVSVNMEDQFIASLRQGNQMHVEYQFYGGNAAKLAVSLRGFSDALDALTSQ